MVATAHSACTPIVTPCGPPLTEQEDALNRHVSDSTGSHVLFFTLCEEGLPSA